MKGFQSPKSGLLTRLAFIILVCFILTSWFEVKQKININKDGSGETELEIAIQKEMFWDQQAIPEFKSKLKEEEWNILGEVEKEGKYVITAEKKFKDISELNDDETRYAFSSKRKGFLKRAYTLEVEQIKSSEMPFPYEISIKVPGSIDETDGEKVSSDKVKWNLRGLSRGTVLSVKSSGFTVPAFAKLIMVMAGLILLFAGVVIVRKIIKTEIPKGKVASRGVFRTQCEKENPATAFFCINCGQRLD
ncbi:MAG: LppM family (lipo)protein [Candidatus Aminicenantia bacterium]